MASTRVATDFKVGDKIVCVGRVGIVTMVSTNLISWKDLVTNIVWTSSPTELEHQYDEEDYDEEEDDYDEEEDDYDDDYFYEEATPKDEPEEAFSSEWDLF